MNLHVLAWFLKEKYAKLLFIINLYNIALILMFIFNNVDASMHAVYLCF